MNDFTALLLYTSGFMTAEEYVAATEGCDCDCATSRGDSDAK